MKQSRLIPLNKWIDYHPWPSTNALRHFYIKKAKNGFDKVIRMVGKRILIDEQSFFKWVEGLNKDRLK